ncbi:Type 1 glutamine amidotransferase-like domain-containing protein [Thermoactinomyces sp. DSM 45892]|uniref:Type 1 glutamine amidotransferase-like domain-containing protein n=1 Tax=Thermoactinomyces sp. DSM 45892 TaxID=1882753 RepID=UPI00089726E0|nr:Type 1 glutamine amidotransferase-like domain-containing protein [Thermoactinomyces sp. DSM 45892]SDY24005.1 dipeptidase E [Thermoactinomyces sp. DSM 45892]
MIRYLFSKIDCLLEFENGLKETLNKDFKTNKIVFIPSTPDEHLKTRKYTTEILDYFRKVDVVFRDSVILYSEVENEVMRKELESADAICLMGGDTLQQYDFIKKNDLQITLKNCKGVIVGISAGAINMCKTAVLTQIHEVDQNYVYSGFNLVDITVEVHFERGNKVQEETVLDVAKNMDHFYCIADSSAIRFDDENKMRLFGDGIYKVSSHGFMQG